MERRTRKQNNKGITLIALVISIIVMLILAGVSINAIVGDNGILSRTQYATFINEMTAVEEAVQMWKAGEVIGAQGEDTKVIPTNGLCKVTDLNSPERLKGEVGYYRVWSMSKTRPEISVLTNASDFNIKFESEMIFYPAGVQDLYYLNNEACGIDSKKTYLIDAATGMVYSMTGIGLKGVSCYSLNMAKAVMNGDITAPQFAVAEVSGTGSGDKLAGNNEPEFLPDGTENPDYNPYGFQIIASKSTNNIYKLYNNGDLYGKGIKGISLNTSTEDMNSINASVYSVLTFPGEMIGTIGNVNYNDIITSGAQVITGNSAIYVLNSKGELWAWGANSYNMFGLSQDQRIEYTGREAIKLDVAGKKIKKVFPTEFATYVLTDEAIPELYAAGCNETYGKGMLGVGHENVISSFEKVEFERPETIVKIEGGVGNTYRHIILCSDDRMYGSGHLGEVIGGEDIYYNKFTRIMDGNLGEKMDDNIKDFFLYRGMIILSKDNKLYSKCTDFYCWAFDEGVKGKTTLCQFPTTFSTDVKAMYHVFANSVLIERNNGEFWINGYNTRFGKDFQELDLYQNQDYKFCNVTELFPAELKNNIKKIIPIYGHGCYFISNDNEIYYVGYDRFAGINSSINQLVEFKKLKELGANIGEFGSIKDIYNPEEFNNRNFIPLIITNDGRAVLTYFQEIIFRDKILQQNWAKVNDDNVKVKKIQMNTYNSGFLDTSGNLWITGTSSKGLGINSETEIYNKFTIHPDNRFLGKVKDFLMRDDIIMILTTDGDLYSTGTSQYLGLPSEELTDGWAKTFCLSRQNVSKIFSDEYNYSFYMVADSKLYFMGWNFYGIAPGVSTPSRYAYEWMPVTLPSGYTTDNIVQCFSPGSVWSAIVVEKDNIRKLFIAGENSLTGGYPGVNGLGKSSWGVYSELTLSELETDEYISKFAGDGNHGGYMITNKGRLFGWGNYDKLGIGSMSSNNSITPKNLKMSNISQCVVGPNWIIIVDKDGKVYGTGSNKYGILGRWVGSPRGSRYRTAFDWVECPDLEI